MTDKIFKPAALISLVFLILLVSGISVEAGTHGVNGYVYDCNSGFNVTGADVSLHLIDKTTGLPKTSMILTTNVKSNGWYTIDVGNFDNPWIKGDVVLIDISKDSYSVSTNVTLTEAGNDQAFAVCLGPSEDFTCACGNGVCEYWKPLCENATFKVKGITTQRCPEDCADCICGNDKCQPECGEDMVNCPEDCPPGYCGDGLCQSPVGENIYTCPEDCGYFNKDMPSCGNGICEPTFGETWETCPADCYGLFATCGDKKCTGAETQDNCCLDCGCPKNKCSSIKCIDNKCRHICCLFGYCCVWLKLCWYWWVLIIILIVAAIIIYILTRQNLRKIINKLASITKLKTVVLAEKTKLYEKWK